MEALPRTGVGSEYRTNVIKNRSLVEVADLSRWDNTGGSCDESTGKSHDRNNGVCLGGGSA